MTEKSFRANAVKKLWSQHVVDILNILLISWLLCLSLNWITCAGFYVLFYRFHIEKSSLKSIAKNSHNLAVNYSPLLATGLSGSSCASILLDLFTGDALPPYSSSKYSWHHLIWVIGDFAFWYHTVSGFVYNLSYMLN